MNRQIVKKKKEIRNDEGLHGKQIVYLLSV